MPYTDMGCPVLQYDPDPAGLENGRGPAPTSQECASNLAPFLT